MSSETFKTDPSVVLYHVKRTVERLDAQFANQGQLISDAAIARERQSAELARFGDRFDALAQEVHALRDQLTEIARRFDTQPIHVGPSAPPTGPQHVVEESKARTRVLIALAGLLIAVTAVVTLGARRWIFGGDEPLPPPPPAASAADP